VRIADRHAEDRAPRPRTYRAVDDVASDVFEWIETWYNPRRRHTSLDMLSALEYESQHYDRSVVTNP
jgi:transposase InsO family protein